MYLQIISSVNIPWPEKGMGDADYIYAFQKVVMPIAMEFAPELVISVSLLATLSFLTFHPYSLGGFRCCSGWRFGGMLCNTHRVCPHDTHAFRVSWRPASGRPRGPFSIVIRPSTEFSSRVVIILTPSQNLHWQLRVSFSGSHQRNCLLWSRGNPPQKQYGKWHYNKVDIGSV